MIAGIIMAVITMPVLSAWADSPQQQLKDGVLPSDISCMKGLKLYFLNFKPICISERSYEKSAEPFSDFVPSYVPTRVWAEPIESHVEENNHDLIWTGAVICRPRL